MHYAFSFKIIKMSPLLVAMFSACRPSSWWVGSQ